MTAATVRWIHSSHALVVVERREHAVVAQRPVGAAHAGVGGAHDDADRDEQDRRDDGGERRASGSGSRAVGSTSGANGWDAAGERRRHSTRSRGRSRGPSRRIPAVPGYALRMPRSLAACSCCSRPSSSPPARRSRADRRRRRPSRSASPATPSVIPVIVSSQQAVGAEPVRVLVPRPEDQPARRRRPTATASVAFIAPGADRARAGRPRDVRVGDRGRRAATTWRTTEFPTTGDWKAVFITQAPNAPQEAIGVGFTVLDKATTVGDRAGGPVDDEPDRRGRRRRPREDLERHPPRSGLLPDDRRGRPRGAQAVRARVRDAGVLHERPVRPDARPGQGGRGGRAQGRRVHQRRAVQAGLRERQAPARPRRATASSRPSTRATSGASCPSRGSSRSGRTGS